MNVPVASIEVGTVVAATRHSPRRRTPYTVTRTVIERGTQYEVGAIPFPCSDQDWVKYEEKSKGRTYYGWCTRKSLARWAEHRVA